MIFTSFKFLVFFCLTVIIYYILPKKEKTQWVLLLAASWIFYLNSSFIYAAFLFGSVLLTYSAGLLIGSVYCAEEKSSTENQLSQSREEHRKNNIKAKIICIAGVIINIGVLVYSKYTNFILGSICNIIGTEFNALNLIVPLGISFYVFQSTGYVIDVYCRRIAPEKNFLKYALFVTFFPQLLQGPISKFSDLAGELYSPHYFDYDEVSSGSLRMLWGFFKKMVIADRAALFANTVFDNYTQFSGLVILAGGMMYTLQLYADFSGYMDIAIGAGEVMGIKMTENFNTPYFSQSVPEFWRRWHMSLSEWFKTYIYFPLGGSRCSKLKIVRNIMIVWITTGIWHGAGVHFIIWGAYFGVIIAMSRLLQPVYGKITEFLKINTEADSYKLFKMLRTSLLVCFGWIMFRAESFTAGIKMIKSIFTTYNPWVLFDNTMLNLGIDGKNMNVLICSVFLLSCVSIANYRGIKVREILSKQNIVFRWIVYFAAIFSVLVFGVYGSGAAANFLYFQF